MRSILTASLVFQANVESVVAVESCNFELELALLAQG